MSKILIDRALLQDHVDKWTDNGMAWRDINSFIDSLEAALAASPAAPDDEIKHIADLERTIKELQLKAALKLGTEHDRIAELERDKADLLENGDRLMRAADGWKEQCKEHEAELLALRTQEPVAYRSWSSKWHDWCYQTATEFEQGWEPLYAAAVAQDTKKLKDMTEAELVEAENE